MDGGTRGALLARVCYYVWTDLPHISDRDYKQNVFILQLEQSLALLLLCSVFTEMPFDQLAHDALREGGGGCGYP
jgi:hypothetical protein